MESQLDWPPICCCCCYVTSVVSDSVWPCRQQPTRLPRPWDSPGKNTRVGCHCLLQCMKMKSESEVAQSCRLFATPWTAAHQAPPSMGFSRQEYWSGVPLPSRDHLSRYPLKFIHQSLISHTNACASGKYNLKYFLQKSGWKLLELNNKKQTPQFKNGQRTWIGIFLKICK